MVALWANLRTRTEPIPSHQKPGRRRTVKDALFQRRWVRDISGAPTMQVLCEYVELWETLEEIRSICNQQPRIVSSGSGQRLVSTQLHRHTAPSSSGDQQ